MSRILTTQSRPTQSFPCPAGSNFKCPDPKLRSVIESCWKVDPNDRPDFNYLSESFRDFFQKEGNFISIYCNTIGPYTEM